ncbi:ABC transporter ATP-binding protein [Microbaculum marinisediminis]|uniref:ABC transporter ATP-binding protein n=1 Tax=Microbaculum marinisediminis TaxID=2931392 RepID=A0AAW5R3K0_9HYPH|nr:ABC transporter ATP-binding protein [Microbaculum sp. A6E488]MCT8973433.1 ABC transporter ATP-binding protein [Microbaculum sp. A6E488]
MAAVTLLRTEGLCRYFDGLRAVDGVSFSLDAGEIRAIIGPNGAGKTTFVSLICGRVLPTAGRIAFEGRDISALPAFRRVGLGIAYTFQITSIFGNLTVFDNVALAVQNSMQRTGGSGLWLDEREMAARVADALDRVGLTERHDTRASALSYGHQRLLEVAMGLALSPKLLILDEPTQGLSDAEIAGFCDLVREIAKDATVLLIEHNMDVVMDLASRITVMNNGTILSEGTPDEVRADEAVQRAYLGT